MKKEILKLSVITWWEPFLYIVVLLISFFYLAQIESITNTFLIVYIALILSGVMTIIEIIKHKNNFFKIKNLDSLKTESLKSENRELNLWEIFKESLVKYLGVVFGMIFILFCFWFFPEYDVLKFKGPIEESQTFIISLVLLLAFPMIFLSNLVLGFKKDGTYNFGLFFTLQIEKIDWKIFRDGILEWTIRLIFLTLNFTSAVKYVELYRENIFNLEFYSKVGFTQGVMLLEAMIFMIIIIVILPGYLFSWRMIGNETKKIDSTWFAWTFLLICYQPFIGKIFSEVFKYSTPNNWATILNFSDILLIIFGISILFFAFVHLWAEAALGIRSSNLSHKGIITNGIFRYTKHPVYLSKILSWFLISLPFFNGATALESVQLGIAFLFVCAIFAARSLSEERLLATDETYVKYALWMDKYATFAFISKIFPFMSFEWRYDYWVKNNLLK